jgi:hypothetical protein
MNAYSLTRVNFFSNARHCTIQPIKGLIVCEDYKKLRRMHPLKVSVPIRDLHFFLHIDCLCLFVQPFLCKILLKRMHPLKISVLLNDLHLFLHIDCLCLFVQFFLCKTLLRRMHPLKVNIILKVLHFFLHIDCLCLFVQSICVKLC